MFHRTIWSKTPRATPAAKAFGSDAMPDTTAAASAGSSSAGPAAASIGRPCPGARSTTVRAANPPTMAHTIVESRRTGIPSSSARSVFSAMARTARPSSVRSRNQLRAASTTGTTATMSRSLPVSTSGWISTCTSVSGVRNDGTRGDRPNSIGTSISAPPRTWASPMVATVNTSLDAVAKRRITSRSTTIPVTTPAATAVSAATGHGTFPARYSSIPTTAGNPPMAP